MTMKFQTYYDRDYKDKSIEFDPNSSLTDQDFKIQTDIDYLLSHMAGHSRTPLYGVQDTMTFEEWNNEMALVKRRFMHLEPEQRLKFGNAQNFLKWCADPDNYREILPSTLEEQDRIKKDQEYEEKETKRAQRLAKAIKGE